MQAADEGGAAGAHPPTPPVGGQQEGALSPAAAAATGAGRGAGGGGGGAGAVSWQLAAATDPGGGRENQDDFFIWEHPGGLGFAIGILDGHGRDVGKLAANTAAAELERFFEEHFEAEILQREEDGEDAWNGEAVSRRRYECMVNACYCAHEAIKDAFKLSLAEDGWEVRETQEGYLTKRRKSSQPWVCVHGGTSCSLVAIAFKPHPVMVVANVGDSDGLLSTERGIIPPTTLIHMGDASYDMPFQQGVAYRRAMHARRLAEAGMHDDGGDRKMDVEGASGGGGGGGDDADAGGDGTPAAMAATLPARNPVAAAPPQGTGHMNGSEVPGSATMLLTANHSPEAIPEFERLRRFAPSPSDSRHPKLLVIYDAPTNQKQRCTPVFNVDAEGTPTITGTGKYYKNVRREWASLVATPSNATYQDALAFTRSLGDFHLHSYGVSASPEVAQMDLAPLLSGAYATAAASSGGGGGSDDADAAASDGGGGKADDGAATTDADGSSGAADGAAGDASHEPPLLALLVATDGVWDNWKYEDSTLFVQDASCTQAARSRADGARRVVHSFMNRNALFARRNFGASADNATAVLAYITLGSLPTSPPGSANSNKHHVAGVVVGNDAAAAAGGGSGGGAAGGRKKSNGLFGKR